MLGLAAVCWAIWLARNKIFFENKSIKNPGEVFFSSCGLMQYWSGLYPGDAQEVIETRVQVMINEVVQILEKKQKGCGARLMLMPGEASRDEDEAGENHMSTMIPKK
jgi:hypothetical protein